MREDLHVRRTTYVKEEGIVQGRDRSIGSLGTKVREESVVGRGVPSSVGGVQRAMFRWWGETEVEWKV